MSFVSDNGKEEINRLKGEADNAKATPYEVPFITGVFLHFLSIFSLIDQVPLITYL